jgi:hypothetical protein
VPGAEIEIRGTKGTFYLTGRGWEVVPDALTPNEFPARTPLTRAADSQWRKGEARTIEPRKVTASVNSADTNFHARNFLDCVKSRQRPHCDIETGHRSTSTTLLANIAHQSRALLEWDAQAERFTNNDAANKKLSYRYRAPYELPAV